MNQLDLFEIQLDKDTRDIIEEIETEITFLKSQSVNYLMSGFHAEWKKTSKKIEDLKKEIIKIKHSKI